MEFDINNNKSWMDYTEYIALKEWYEECKMVFDRINNDILTSLKNAVKYTKYINNTNQ